jgi:hypothetical protein
MDGMACVRTHTTAAPVIDAWFIPCVKTRLARKALASGMLLRVISEEMNGG